jgi:perosamine synthetase
MADQYRSMRIRNAELYRKYLRSVDGITFQKTRKKVIHVHWMNGILVDSEQYGHSRDDLVIHLKSNNIDTRMFFIGMHKQPSLLNYGCDGSGSFPVTERLGNDGFYLPSASSLKEEDIRYICDTIQNYQR